MTVGKPLAARFAVPCALHGHDPEDRRPVLASTPLDALAARWLLSRPAYATSAAEAKAAPIGEVAAFIGGGRKGRMAAAAMRKRRAAQTGDVAHPAAAEQLARTMRLELAMHGGDLAAAWRFYRNENLWEATTWQLG